MRTSSWDEAAAWLRGAGWIEAEGERAITLRRPVARERGRVLAPVVQASATVVRGRPWLVLLCPICEPGDLAEGAALRHNADLAAGALCLVDGGYALRHAAPLGDVDLEELLDLLAHEAARLRAHVARAAAGAPSLFDGYAL